MKRKEQSWVAQVNDGGWRETKPQAGGYWSAYVKVRHGVRFVILRPSEYLGWRLLINGIVVARGDLGDMLTRAEALQTGVATCQPGARFSGTK